MGSAHNVVMSGRVYLIGAGPGDPGLLTLRGAEALACADVVLYDGLSNRDLLKHAARAEHICVGKHGQSRIWKQDEIIREILHHAGNGKVVARLKGGDPAIFARSAEEAEAVAAAGIPLEIIPGITAALAASSYAGIPVTHRGLASAVALVTGHEEPNKTSQQSLDWKALASFPGTLVVYMGVTTAETWTGRLIEGGKPPETPVAIIRRCSLADQKIIRCQLREVAGKLNSNQSEKIRPPVIVIVGEVARLGGVAGMVNSFDCFSQGPLSGQTILVTRPADQAESLADPLRKAGAKVLVQPAIQITEPDDWTDVDRAIDTLPSIDFLIFCSRNGVRHFLGRIWETGNDLRRLANLSIAVVGKKTAEALGEFQLKADVVPTNYHAESLASELADHVSGKRVLIIRASRGRQTLAESLEASGATVEQVVGYQHRDVVELDPDILKLAEEGEIDWITVTSSESAGNLHRLLGDTMNQMKFASISPITSESLRKLGYRVDAEADPHTMIALVESILKAVQ